MQSTPAQILPIVMQDYRTLANLLRTLADEQALGSLPAVDRDWIESKVDYLAAHDPEASNCETAEEVRRRHGEWMSESGSLAA